MKTTSLLIGLLFSFTLFAQRLELGLTLAASTYKGDMTPNSVWTSIGTTHFGYGASVRYNFNSFLSARVGYMDGAISGDDVHSSSQDRLKRNLNFHSDLKEWSLIGEFNVFSYRPDKLKGRVAPYIFGGIALYKFNPRTWYNGQWVDLQPLGTEGQGLPQFPERSLYALTQIAVPLGAGFKFTFDESWTITIETGIRKTFTDYLDDVSNTYVNSEEILAVRGPIAAALSNRSGSTKLTGRIRGDPASGDWYIFSGVSVYFHFWDKGVINIPNVFSNKFGCPRWAH